ncbi:MAG TPA: tRNA 2-thiouridine(34) synthase MnmA [Acidimicrobiales bacterium]|nr:tRNA 2-thiouridine(34) synthase MnmA [Acidimicrobiales bacterium]
MKVLVAMSGGVDSSVAAALMLQQGHDVVGVTLKLWGGAQDSGCCSVGDVEDARRVAQQLGITHHVFNFTDDFDAHVVEPYVEAHAAGRTPNPCVECNRHLKFDRLLARADQLGFDAIATGHHARVERDVSAGRFRLMRGVDAAKDQSYVLHMLSQDQLARVLFPVGDLTKPEVRRLAAALGLRTADKPDSQDTCFITATGGRESFLGGRIALRPGRLVEASTGVDLGEVAAIQLVTVGQRRGLGLDRGGDGDRRYALAVDVASSTVSVGSEDDLRCRRIDVGEWTWVDARPDPGSEVRVQVSAHGRLSAAVFDARGVGFDTPQRRVAPGQAVVLYDAVTGLAVLGGGIAG